MDYLIESNDCLCDLGTYRLAFGIATGMKNTRGRDITMLAVLDSCTIYGGSTPKVQG